ncbi:MAG: DegT/DnrJ/EryC1/StrS family aminotransferase, partial [Gemmatimonadota bacterium]
MADEIRARFGPAETVLTGSGTEALELAIRLSGMNGSKRRPVGLPAFSCFDVATAAVGAGAPVLFYDVDPDTLTPESQSLDRVLAESPRAVVVANLFGYPIDWTSVRDRCRAAGVVLIEDAAQGLGSTWNGRQGGTFGDLTVLSFGRGKGWTGGSGGSLMVRIQLEMGGLKSTLRASSLLRNLSAAATCFAQWALGRPTLYWLPQAIPGIHLGETRYKTPVPPARMAAFSAALASFTEAAAAEEIRRRETNARKLRDLFLGEGVSGDFKTPNPIPGGSSAYNRFPLLA